MSYRNNVWQALLVSSRILQCKFEQSKRPERADIKAIAEFKYFLKEESPGFKPLDHPYLARTLGAGPPGRKEPDTIFNRLRAINAGPSLLDIEKQCGEMARDVDLVYRLCRCLLLVNERCPERGGILKASEMYQFSSKDAAEHDKDASHLRATFKRYNEVAPYCFALSACQITVLEFWQGLKTEHVKEVIGIAWSVQQRMIGIKPRKSRSQDPSGFTASSFRVPYLGPPHILESNGIFKECLEPYLIATPDELRWLEDEFPAA